MTISNTSHGANAVQGGSANSIADSAGRPNIRDSMLGLPGFTQLPLTFLTGKPFSGQKRLRIAPTAHLAAGVFSMAAGIMVGVIALRVPGWTLLWLLPSWALTLHALRNLRMVVYHQCAHRNMWRHSARTEVLVGDLVAGLLMVQSFKKYSWSHRLEHHGSQHMTPGDPTVADFLIGLKLQPGMTIPAMWNRLFKCLFSPIFHIRFFVNRLKSGLLYGSVLQRTLIVGLPLAFVIWGYRNHFVLLAYLVLWLLPITVFFQISTVLRLCVKHTFPSPAAGGRDRTHIASLTNGVFLGEPFPSRGDSGAGTVARYVVWSLRMVFVHLPGRYLVLTGDSVCHDYHHRRPVSRDWSNYIFARQADQDAGHPGWPAYREVWGLVAAINQVFESLRLADPEIYDSRKLAGTPDLELYSSFDD